ncbi:MAG TPA: glycosyltransferase [Bacteroidales bacterium]|nr:glycosyltransferase [Bacteroidales bacterium]
MKILFVKNTWIGNVFDSFVNSFKKSGHEVNVFCFRSENSIMKKLKLHNIIQVKNFLTNREIYNSNRLVLNEFQKFKPDLFISINEASILPETVNFIQKKNCFTVNFVADNPFDPLRFSFYPITLKYYNLIFVHDKIWIHSIRNIAPKSRVEKIICGGGYDPSLFFPVEYEEITDDERERLKCDISFTGESYWMKGEGGYRAGILDQLGDYNVKIWGDSGWKKRFPYYFNLKRFYQGERLTYEDLRKLYRVSIIVLNMPSPQIFTGFQPRTFEIAACKGFQIADWREELDEWFTEDELVTFKDIPDLFDKIEFFLKNPDKRASYVENIYKKVVNNYTWDERVKDILNIITECL